MHELVTHTAGYAEFGDATLRRAAWAAPLGLNFFTADSTQMTEETRAQTLSARGQYAYSSLGSAIAGSDRSGRRRTRVWNAASSRTPMSTEPTSPNPRRDPRASQATTRPIPATTPTTRRRAGCAGGGGWSDENGVGGLGRRFW
jgi:hypothetical protein